MPPNTLQSLLLAPISQLSCREAITTITLKQLTFYGSQTCIHIADLLKNSLALLYSASLFIFIQKGIATAAGLSNDSKYQSTRSCKHTGYFFLWKRIRISTAAKILKTHLYSHMNALPWITSSSRKAYRKYFLMVFGLFFCLFFLNS